MSLNHEKTVTKFCDTASLNLTEKTIPEHFFDDAKYFGRANISAKPKQCYSFIFTVFTERSAKTNKPKQCSNKCGI